MYKSTVYDIAKTELKKFAKKVVDTCLCNKEEIDLVLGQFIKEMTK